MLISIHALLAESDLFVSSALQLIPLISIHALLAESDRKYHRADRVKAYHFYPRSPCGERPPRGGSCYLDNIISIHALLAESDHYDNYNLHCVEISIHALLAESDAIISKPLR